MGEKFSLKLNFQSIVSAIALALGIGGVGGHAVLDRALTEDQIRTIVSEVTREAVSPVTEESLPEFTHRVDDEHEDCVLDAMKSMESSTDRLLARIVCDFERESEYSRRSAR